MLLISLCRAPSITRSTSLPTRGSCTTSVWPTSSSPTGPWPRESLSTWTWSMWPLWGDSRRRDGCRIGTTQNHQSGWQLGSSRRSAASHSRYVTSSCMVHIHSMFHIELMHVIIFYAFSRLQWRIYARNKKETSTEDDVLWLSLVASRHA